MVDPHGAFDLDAYLARIGHVGPVAPTLATLNALIAAHVRTIPFENLDVLLSQPIELDAASLQRKLVRGGRGGYCFEQNGLFLLVLAAIGFDAKPMSARVRIQRPRDFTPPRTHLFSRVELDGASWLADVGIGALSPTCALRLDAAGEQPTPHEPRRIVREEGRLFHQVRFDAEWHDVCEFTLEEMPLIDRELANYFTSTHPKSHFKDRLMVARATADGRKTILNRDLTVRRKDGQRDIHTMQTPEELLEVLAREFDLRFDPGTRFACPALDWP